MENERLIEIFFNDLKKYLKIKKTDLITDKIIKVNKLNELKKLDRSYESVMHPGYYLDKTAISREIDTIDIELNEIQIINNYILESDRFLIDDIILENIYRRIMRDYQDYDFPKEVKDTFLYKKVVTDMSI